ncbi:MAG: iron ABC transporter permease [Solobacterium sp.]|jgi:iron complex transport system permease protein|nr:iron ABC transporter permease [Solobacterium sp.]MCH4222034.1 iron ABC transporter permease [Solobacterium sp.]MCH4265696.1 iron ABC transporter permease [Solobacterium sp.]
MSTSTVSFTRSHKKLLLLGILLSVLALFCSIFWSSPALSFQSAWNTLFGNGTSGSSIILFQIRMPRAFAAFVCGAGLSVAGLLLQSSLNNTLASPSTIGVTSGAGVFALIASLLFTRNSILSMSMTFLGAIFSAMLVYLISIKAGTAKTTVILAGVAVSSLMNAVSSALIVLYPDCVTDKLSFQLGGLSGVTWNQLGFSFIFIVIGLIVAMIFAGGIDLFQLGDEMSCGLGLKVKTVRLVAIFTAALLSAAAVSICGLISFVGLMVPNLVRMICRDHCRGQITLCAVYGGAFLVVCDLISRLLFFPYELPVGLLLAFLGTPFFIYILMKRKRKLSV